MQTAGSSSSNRIELPALAFSKPSYVVVLLEGRTVSAPAGVGKGPSSEVIRSEGARSWITRHQQPLADELALMQRRWTPPPNVSFLALVYGEVPLRSPPSNIPTRQWTRQFLVAPNDEAALLGGSCDCYRCIIFWLRGQDTLKNLQFRLPHSALTHTPQRNPAGQIRGATQVI